MMCSNSSNCSRSLFSAPMKTVSFLLLISIFASQIVPSGSGIRAAVPHPSSAGSTQSVISSDNTHIHDEQVAFAHEPPATQSLSWITNPANGHTYAEIECGSWTNCAIVARSFGAHLVTITDEAEQAWLITAFSGSREYWIGLTDEAEEGLWLWVNGETVSYTNWAPSEPNNFWSCGEDYVMMNWLRPGQWNDMGSCSPEWPRITSAIIEQSNSQSEDATPLELGVPFQDTIDTLNWKTYSLNVPAGLSLQVEVTPSTEDHQLWFYGSLHKPTSLIAHEMHTRIPTPRGTYVLLLAPTQSTTYYFSLFNRQQNRDAAQYTILAQAIERTLVDVTPDSAGNAGETTLQISGLGFVDGMQAILSRAGYSSITASSVQHISPQTLVSTFDFRGAAPGTYTLRVTQTGADPLIMENAFTITTGSGAQLEASIEAPDAVRPQRNGTVWLHYQNTGDADMLAPVFTISNSGSPLPMKLQPDEPFQPGPMQVLGIHQGSGAAGVLPPGASGRIPVYFRSDTSARNIRFDLSVLEADDQVIDWAAIEAELRPDDINPDLWPLIWNRFVAQVGTTGADYQRALTERASHLSQYGEYVADVRDLLGMMLNQAAGVSVPQTLTASLDASAPAAALPLRFGRIATLDPEQRFTPGSFGRGWNHNLAYTLQMIDANTITIVGPDGSSRLFRKTGNGAWQGAAGDPGVLRPAGGGYQLSEVSGLQWQFDGEGRLSTISEPNGNQITLSYSNANLTRISHSNGQQFELTYNGQGRMSQVTDHAGRVTTYTYDGSGNYLQSVTAPGAMTTSYRYNDANGSLADHTLREIAFADGTHRYFSYDEAGRLAASWRDGDAERVSYAYDVLGTVTATDASGNATVLRTGTAGQPLLLQNALDAQLRFEYDANRNLTGVRQPDGTRTAIRYDGRGNPIGAEDARGANTSAAYTPDLNRLNWLRDARNNLTDFSYDDDGNLTAITYPDSSAQTFGYDAAGNLTSATNRRGQTISYSYNAAGQITTKNYPEGRQISYSYDSVGRLTSVSDAAGTISLNYDERDLLTSISYPSGRSLSFNYNAAGRRTSLTSNDGYVLNYAYDAAGRLSRISDGNGTEIIRYEYDSVGRLSREIKGNGTTSIYSYDAANQLLSIVHQAPDTSIQSRLDYTYDAVGNRTSLTTLEGVTSYSYDATGQLIGVTYPDGSSEQYTYDEVGNRVVVTDGNGATGYTTNELNQYTRVGDTSYEYDADGNMTAMISAGGRTSYEYDSENRLVVVTKPGGDTWRYSYDALGNRQSVEENGAETAYLNDPTGLVNVIAAYAGDGSLNHRYMHGLGLAAQRDAADNTAYYSYDATGNTRQVTDQSGTVANSYTYTPFGETLQASETIANPFQYVGRFGVMNEENGLQFMRARYYSAELGRFTAQDPIGFMGGDVNLYRYAHGNPILWIDPHGLDVWSTSQLIREATDERVEQARRKVEALKEQYLQGSPEQQMEYILALQEYDQLRRENALRMSRSGSQAGYSIVTGINQTMASAPNSIGAFIGVMESNIAGLIQFVELNWWKDWRTFESITDFLGAVQDVIFGVQKVGEATTLVIRPIDPNDKLGPPSVAPDGELVYTIRFENLATATATVQELVITDNLSPDLDWTTLRFLDVGYGDRQLAMDDDGLEVALRDLPPPNDPVLAGTAEGQLAIEVNGSFDPASGQLVWRMQVIDTATGEFPEDPRAGFLPPEDGSGRGQGYVSFAIEPRPGLALGSFVSNQASIVFDTNEAIVTNEVRTRVGYPVFLPVIVCAECR